MKHRTHDLQKDGRLQIRNERPEDYRQVEEMTRRAFYNLYVPGCTEHYLVHVMRSHPDFLPQLDLVAELDGRVVGNIMYPKAALTGPDGEERQILTFGPISVLPEYQRMGIGKLLMEESFRRAAQLGYEVVVITGSPSNYVTCGFQSCKKHHICLEDGTFPAALLVKELRPGALDGRKYVYRYSPVMQIDEQAAQRFDSGFEPMEKKHQASQEEFYILSNATL